MAAVGLPMGIFFFGASSDAVDLWRNYRKIRQLNAVINDRQKQKDELSRQVELLKKQDPGAWTQAFREQAQALLPTEVEYRFKDR